MSTNQYRGKEETDKKDFGKLSVEEQKRLSEEAINEDEQDEEAVNEKLAEKNKLRNEKEQSKRIH